MDNNEPIKENDTNNQESDNICETNNYNESDNMSESGNHNDAKKAAVKKSARSIITELLIYVIILFACIYIVPEYVMQRTVVDGESMMDTLTNGESLIVNKLAYKFGDPDRFDIVVFYPYGREDKDDYYVKRIIGLPGEKVQIIGSDIYINDQILEEHYGKDPITDSGIFGNPVVLGEDEFFVLGDNREISEDSRFFGPVKRENLSGHVVLRIYPFDKFGLLTNK